MIPVRRTWENAVETLERVHKALTGSCCPQSIYPTTKSCGVLPRKYLPYPTWQVQVHLSQSDDRITQPSGSSDRDRQHCILACIKAECGYGASNRNKTGRRNIEHSRIPVPSRAVCNSLRSPAPHLMYRTCLELHVVYYPTV